MKACKDSRTDACEHRLPLGRIMIFTCSIIFILLTFVLTPIYVNVSTDIVTGVTALPTIMYLLIDLFEVATFALAFSTIIHASVSSGARYAWRLCGVYVALCAVRRGITLLISFVSTGRADILEIFSIVVYVLLDAIIAVIVTTFICRIASAHTLESEQKKKAALRLGEKTEQISFLSKVYSSDDPYCRCALVSGIIISAVKMISRAISDIFEGAPESVGEALVMVAYYLSDVLICAVFYILAWFILSALYKRSLSVR